MDTINYNRFNREIKSPVPSNAITYLIRELRKGSFSFSDFWQSPKREKMSSTEFLHQYFKCKDSCADIITYFYENNNHELVYVIKEIKAFRKLSHFDVIKTCYGNDSKFILELTFWKNCFESSAGSIDKINARYVSQFTFEEILLLCGFYYEKLRISKSFARSTDSNLIQVVSAILNYKLRKSGKQDDVISSKYGEFEFINLGLEILNNLIVNGDRDIAELFNVIEADNQLHEIYDRYCFQEFSLNFIEDKEVTLRPDNVQPYLKYRNNGAKYPYWQNYHQNNFAIENEDIIESIANANISWYNKQGSTATQINYNQYIDAGFPEEITIQSNKAINAIHCFQVLNSLSAWTNIRWNNFVEMQILTGSQKNPYKVILEIIAHNQISIGNSILPVCNRVYDDLVKKTSEILKFGEETARLCLKLLTNNLAGSNHKVNLLETPFLKVGKNIYWIAGIFSNKNYCVSLQNVLLKNNDTIRKIVGERTEENLAYWFQKNNFSIVSNHKYIDHKGEIDLLAFKDGYLFISEIKSTYNRTTLREITQHRSDEDRGINKAISQLKRDIAYLKLHWNQIKTKLNTNLDFSELNIIPMAVTSSLEENEGRLQIAGFVSFIASYFDLMLILSNKKALLWNLPEMALLDKFSGKIPTKYLSVAAGLMHDESIAVEIGGIVENYVLKHDFKTRTDLWSEATGFCSPKDLYNALNKGLLWDFIPENNKVFEKELIIVDHKIRFSD